MIQSVLLKRCYDSVKAHMYINELNNRGIYAFLFNEHSTDLIPFGDGGYLIHVNADQLDEAATIIEELEKQETKEAEFHDATMDDIEYEKLKSEQQKSNQKKHRIIMIGVIALIILILISYFITGSIIK